MGALEAARLLGVAPGADPVRVEQAFRDAARRHHPDRGGDAEVFASLLEARAVLRRSAADQRRNPERVQVRRPLSATVRAAVARRLPRRRTPRVD